MSGMLVGLVVARVGLCAWMQVPVDSAEEKATVDVPAREGSAPGADEDPTAELEAAADDTVAGHAALSHAPGAHVGRTLHAAANGGDDAVGPGLRPAARAARDLAATSTATARRVVDQLPSRAADAQGALRARAAERHARNTARVNALARDHADAWNRVAKRHALLPGQLGDAATTARDGVRGAHRSAVEARADTAQVMGGLRRGAVNVTGFLMDTAAEDLGQGTRERLGWGAAHVNDVAHTVGGGVADSVAAAGSVPRRAWRTTVDGVGGTLRGLAPETARVGRAGAALTADQAGLVGGSMPVPARLGLRVAREVTTWNLEQGYQRGLVGGMGAARNAMDHDDPGAAVAFGGASVGKAAWHLLVLQPLLLGAVGAVVTGAYGALLGLGIPWVAHVGVGSAVFTGLCAVSGVVGAAAMALLGSAGTLLATGGTVVRVAGTVAAGAAWLGAALVGSGAWVAGRAGLALAALGTIPLVSAGFMVALHAWWGAALGLVAGRAVAGAGAMVALGGARGTGAVLGTTGHAVLSGARAAALTTATALATGGATAASWVAGGWDVVHAAGTDPWVAPVQAVGALGVLGAGGAGAALTLALGAAGWTVMVPVLATRLGVAGARTGFHAVALGPRVVRAAVDIPQHRAWAAHRAAQVEAARAGAAAQGVADLGDVAVVRVTWWGAQTGRVRFFVTRNAAGERRYFQRAVDAQTCRVGFRHTRQDPAARVGGARWEGTVETPVQDERCLEARGQG